MDKRIEHIYKTLYKLYDRESSYNDSEFFKSKTILINIINFEINYNERFVFINIHDHRLQDKIFNKLKYIDFNTITAKQGYFKKISFVYNKYYNNIDISFVRYDAVLGAFKLPIKEELLIEILDLNNNYDNILLELEKIILEDI
jgi:hypothetical protein